jgi:acid phosphatase (class A)
MSHSFQLVERQRSPLILRQKISLVFSLLLAFFSLAAFATGKTYITAADIDLTKLLAPVPSVESTKAEIEEMLKLESSRDSAAVEYARSDTGDDIFRFSTVLGPAFKKADMPVTEGFFEQIVHNEKSVIDPAKVYWKRIRPSVFDPRLHPCVRVPLSGSYPSGHSTFGNLSAIILADMIPEKKAEIYKRGWEFAMNRVIGGVHYPSDIQAGRIAAAIIAAALFRNAEFKADFEKSKAEIRKAIGLEAANSTIKAKVK